MDECEKFMGLEDWKTEIEKQEKNVEVFMIIEKIYSF